MATALARTDEEDAGSPTAASRSALLKPMLIGAALAFSIILLAFATHAAWEERWLFATRWTARASLVLFTGAYLLRSVSRRAFGLAFAGTHLVHAGAFTVYIIAYDVPRGMVSTVGGTIGYAVLTAMVVATFVPVAASARLRRWGMAYLWLVFMSSYLGRLVERGDRLGEGLFGVIVLLAIPSIRAMQARRGAGSDVQTKSEQPDGG